MPLRSRLRDEAFRFVGALAVDSFFNGASRFFRYHPHAKPQRHGLEHIADLRYKAGTTREHLLDVWRPATDAKRRSTGLFYDGPPWPIVFYVHGGGFRILSKDTHWIMALGFGRRGCIVFNTSYRLGPKHRFPAAIEDVCDAYVWMTKNAARFGGDLDRVVIAGESAGANLASALAIALHYERPEPFARRAFDTGVVPRAIIPACGVFQVSDLARLERRKPKMSRFIVDRLLEVEEAYLGDGPWPWGLDLADTASFFERGEPPARPIAPWFLPVGTKDPLLPDTRRLAEALRAIGVTAVDRYYPGELHAFHALVMLANARQCWRDTYDFLATYVPGADGSLATRTTRSPFPTGSSSSPPALAGENAPR